MVIPCSLIKKARERPYMGINHNTHPTPEKGRGAPVRFSARFECTKKEKPPEGGSLVRSRIHHRLHQKQ
jgi:hypothetical protein